MKKKIQVCVEDNIKYDLEGNITEALIRLNAYAYKYGPDAVIEIGQESDQYDYSGNEYAFIRVHIVREETDDEYAARINRETQQQTAIAEREAAEFERLKKKFEGGK